MKYRIVKPIKRWPGVGQVVDTAPQVAKPWLDSGHLEKVVAKKSGRRKNEKSKAVKKSRQILEWA